MRLAACFTVLLALLAVAQSSIVSRDVCIIGGGIGGMSAAVYLKDRGYNPLVIEKVDVLGGCCNTVTFPVSNPATQTNAIDIGVIAFANTSFFTQAGFGGWSIDSEAFFSRFVGAQNLIPLSDTIPIFGPNIDVDMKTGQIVLPADTNVTALGIAITRYLAFLGQYPWANTWVDKPDPIPAELLQPFEQFIEANDYQVLGPVFRGVTSGAITDYTALSVFEAMRMAVNIQGMLSLVDAGPNAFSIKGGCIKLYDGMAAYIGSENIWTGANVEALIRPPAGINLPATLAGIRKTKIGPITTELPFIQTCDKVFIAIPQILSNLNFVDLDTTEHNVFSSVQHFNYYVTSVDVAGPQVNNAPNVFMLNNFQQGQLYGLPQSPAIVNMFRGYTYGPAACQMNSAAQISLDDMVSAAQAQLNKIPHSIFTSATASRANAQYHQFEPHFPSSQLGTSPTAFTKLNNLQGHRNTYYGGSLLSTVSHVLIINWSNEFVNAHFPSKVHHG